MRNKVLTALVAAALSVGYSVPALGVPNLVINPTGGTSSEDGLKIELFQGSFVVTRDARLQTYDLVAAESNNGLHLALTPTVGILNGGDPTADVYRSPGYDKDSFPTMLVDSVEVVSTDSDTTTYTASMYADVDQSTTFDDSVDVRVTIKYEYTAPNNYFLATYTVTPPASGFYNIDLYHNIDMKLNDNDNGPGITGTGLNETFTGRYILQEGDAIGGFAEASDTFSSYVADDYDFPGQNESETGWEVGKRGPLYGEPFPNFVNADAATDIGVSIHFDLGAPTETVAKTAYLIFTDSLASTSEGPATSAPYTGPVLTAFSSRTLDVCTPKSITITGSRLSDAVPSIQGKSVTVLENTDSKLVLAFPAGLTPGNNVDLVIDSAAGKLTYQDAFDIPADTCAGNLSKGRWTQLQADGKTVKMYAKDPIGDGKIQFFVYGKEIAWINAVDETDPKLRKAGGYQYLVRTVTLQEGKNRFEIKLDGVRVWRATYVPKG
jgi:hypothetical protein